MADRIRQIAEEAGLSNTFPPEVGAEVDAYLIRPGIDDPDLVDLTAIPFVTIDGPYTRDLDQAVHVELTPDGFRLRYAIADASYYVRPGTALLDESLRRGSSFYLPGRSIPMLPRPLSEGLVSLGPEVDRRALVFDVVLDVRGTVTSLALARARIRSRAKLTFDGVQAFIDSGEPILPRAPDASASLHALVRLGALRAVHEDRAAMIRYRRVETSVRLGPDGVMIVVATPRSAVELANEQISILCNGLGARYLQQGPAELVQPIYRVHEPPEDARVEAFARLVARVAAQRGLPDDPWLYRRAADLGLAGYLEALPSAGPQRRVARALHRQAMLLNGRSRFDSEPTGHFGVGESVYSRFTSPMREVVGVHCHMQAIERMVGRPSLPRDEDEAIRVRVIEAGNRAKEIQRRLDRDVEALIVATVLEPDLALPLSERPARVGTAVGLTTSRIHVLLDDPPIDVRAPLSEQGKYLGGVWLELVDDGTRLVRKDDGATVCCLGDEVTVCAVAPDAVVVTTSAPCAV